MRATGVLDQLRRLVPLELTVVGPARRQVWPAELAALVREWIDEPTDTGVVQADDVTVDIEATAKRLDAWLDGLPALVARESERLSGRFDLVVGDVPAVAFAAAHRAQIRSVAIANFSWDWIWAELGFEAAARASSEAYARADLLVETVPCAPMHAFAKRVNVGLSAREPSSRRNETRRGLGLDGETVVLVAFQPSFAAGMKLPPPCAGRRFVVPSGWPGDALRDDVVRLQEAVRFEDAIAAADVVLGKPGYGLIGDVEAAGARFLYVPRPGFPENAVLERHLEKRPGSAPLGAVPLADGTWEDELAAIEAAPAPPRADTGGAMRAAREIARLLDVDTGESPT